MPTRQPSRRSLLTGTPATATRGRVLFGGDHNPEQWPGKVWHEDVHLMKEAGVNTVTLGVFSWAKLEPRPGAREFGWLDTLMDLMRDNGIGVVLATPTSSTRRAARPVGAGRRRGRRTAVLDGMPDGVEAVRRGDVLFVLNHGRDAVTVDVPGTHRDLLTEATVTGTLSLGRYGVAVLRSRPRAT